MYREILLNGPNIVGYVRLMLVFTGCLFFNNTVFITFVSLSAILDMFDGYLARKWNQETRFGEWLDVVIDLFTRGLLWCRALPNFGFLIFGFEFLVFVAIQANSHNSENRAWQERKRGLNWLAAMTVSKGFKTIPGAIAIIGLWVLPVWACIMMNSDTSFLVDFLSFSPKTADSFEFLITAFLITSRFHCLHVELSILKNYILDLLES
ncbi:uncharacterized protein [Clytia hemisphaerica]|uniref:Uncharacterized protein n=1 Tax=Clytia hemisphaerica TaxID=252671 RepID=A0A7M5V0W3_9CNID|eukprot:TCONS_00017616-protein